MQATVIDTLRYANRLKDAGVAAPQAEAMAIAINDELTSGLATKGDLRAAVSDLKDELRGAVTRLDRGVSDLRGEIVAVDAKVDGMDAKVDALDAKLGAMDARFGGVETKLGAMDAKFGAMDGKFEAMDEKVDALKGSLGTQGRYVFIVLARIVALGLYNVVAPRFASSDSAAAASQTEAPKTSAPAPESQP